MTERIDKLVAELTLEEKCSLVAGVDLWHTPAIERLGIPAVKMTDGPVGARGAQFTGGPPSACFPCGSALAATWDTDLVARVGAALGSEARAKGAHLLLAPTVNIHRHPLAGRNFECYSEDPYLAARMAVAYITGVQSRGVGATVKHFAANDSEYERFTISSEVGPRALREIYLPPFEAATVEAGAWAVMTAYNRLHGTYCSEHPWLINDLLRGEWAWDGLVMSDWGGTHSTAAAANAGLDLEMPGPPQHMGTKLSESVATGDVAEATVDAKVRRILAVAQRAGAFDGAAPEEVPTPDTPELRALLREAAAAGILLLCNEPVGGRPVLPLDPGARIALVGPGADATNVMGGGSAQVTPPYAVSPRDGLEAAGAAIVFEPGCPPSQPPLLDSRWSEGGFTVETPAGVSTQPAAAFRWTAPIPDRVSVRSTLAVPCGGDYTLRVRRTGGRARLLLDGTVVCDSADAEGPGTIEGVAHLEAGRLHELVVDFSPPETAAVSLEVRGGPATAADARHRAVEAARDADVAVVVVGLDASGETEGRDREHMDLPPGQAELIDAVAAANRRTVVVVNTGAPVRMDWADRVPAVVQMWYPGQEGGHALADVLTGRVNPSGRLPTTFPRRLEDTPAFHTYPGEGGQVHYGEGVFVGYRWYERRDIAPRFPFGHGLSYTTFSYGEMRVGDGGLPLAIEVDVTNTGDRTGAEVVQLYVGDPESSVLRPPKELKGFARVHLAPGETAPAHFTLDARSFSYWDPSTGRWRLEAGTFDLLAGPSSADIRARATIDIPPG